MSLDWCSVAAPVVPTRKDRICTLASAISKYACSHSINIEPTSKVSIHEEKMKIFLLLIWDLPNQKIPTKGPKLNLAKSSLCTEKWITVSLVLTKITRPARSARLMTFKLGDQASPWNSHPQPGPRSICIISSLADLVWSFIHSIDAMQKKLHSKMSPDSRSARSAPKRLASRPSAEDGIVCLSW